MFKRLIATLMVGFTVSAGCTMERADSPSERPIALSQFSGQDLYLASIFGVGPARDAVPSVASYIDPAMTIGADAQRGLQVLADDIGAVNPGFFAQFAADIRTGDRVVIRNALMRAGEATRRAAERRQQISAAELETKQPVSLGSLQKPKDTDDPSGPIAVSVAVAVAVAIVLAIVLIWGVEGTDNTLAIDAIADDLASGQAL